jgi:EAL domain-containing protein (putative c-di-GMP-specific phosphodiesterase class I)/ABC-type amino acid transport substrate-binding protein
MAAPTKGGRLSVTRWRSAIGLVFVLLSGSLLAFDGETIVFGGDAAYPPFEWLDGGTPRGFDIDLQQAIVRRGGANAEHILGDWPDAVRALRAGDVDVLAMFQSEQREREFLFTPPFHFVNHGIFAAAGFEHVTALKELEGLRIAVEELSYAHQSLDESAFPASLTLSSNTLTALQAVAEQRADVAILAAPTATYLIRNRRLPLEQVGPPLWPRGYAFAVRRDRPELAQWLTEHFYGVLRDGTYQSIFLRWEDYLAQRDETLASRILRAVAIPLAVLALFGLGWGWKQRRTVIARTRRVVQEARRRHAAEKQARWATDHDAYTELPRLHHFSARIAAVLEKSDPMTSAPKQVVALKLADQDRTILTLGHEIAIQSTQEFAARLRSLPFDAIGQSGRDVFLVFSDKRRITEELRGIVSLDDTTILSGTPIPRLVSGAATWPSHGRTPEELIRRAETALAVAIAKRESWVEYRRSMEPDESDLELLRLFRETSGNGIHAVYQPQIDLRSGQIVAGEALVRWNAPGIGMVMPGKFIPLLEDSGLVRHVTGRMLRDAVRVSAQLRRDGYPCPISVNVSVSDLLGEKPRQTIFKALRAHDGRPSDLKLELTETGVAERPDTIRWVITRLRENGIMTSVDDFGTGYSSLSYLSDFPIQEVKIDKSFVSGMAKGTKDLSIVRSTIAMAHELGLSVVAEGVETQDQLDLLKAAGCDRAQGFMIAKPLPEGEFGAFIRSRAADRLPDAERSTARAQPQCVADS